MSTAVDEDQEQVLPAADAALSDAIGTGEVVEKLAVRLSNEVVHLLSEQLYTSPLKAIEELVANAYDADAKECRVALFLQERPEGAEMDGLIAVYDDGSGMDLAGLRALWQIGDSPKKDSGDTVTPGGRRAIGKFGIGKLATYAVANRITYVSAAKGSVLHVVCDFGLFKPGSNGSDVPVKLEVRKVDDLPALLGRTDFKAVLERLGIGSDKLDLATNPDWTLCLLDSLKPKAADLQIGRLSWVLRTAMPLKIDFAVYLDGAQQVSSKEDGTPPVQFEAGGLEPERIAALNKKHAAKLSTSSDGLCLIEPSYFPNGICGTVFVSETTLKGKSDRYERSFGFFIRVRGRVVNLDDPLFHNPPHSYTTFNRFRADLEIDDLHADITAPREGVGIGPRRELAVAITHEIGLQARDRFEKWQEEQGNQKLAPEHVRVYVAEHLVERPMADALAMHGSRNVGGEVDRGWLYMEDVAPAALNTVVKQLYEERTSYNFVRSGLGKTRRLTKFDPTSATFVINDDHQLVKAYGDDPRSNELIKLLATAEVMLEVYMVESDIDPFAIGDVLNRRDLLLRSLANDRVYSRKYIADMLRENRDSDIELELAVMAAARSLGFQVKHVAGAGEPDGVARFLDSAMKETKLTLEAKASSGTPQLGALDFAGLQEHKEKHGAAGCLLVAPGYPTPKPGTVERTGDPGAVAHRAKSDEISCWTIEQLAEVVEKAERLEITAEQIAEIVTTRFAPADVTAALGELLAEGLDMTVLYKAIMEVLARMFREEKLKGDTRRISTVAGALAFHPDLPDVDEDQIRRAIADLAHQSKGGMVLRNDAIVFLTDFEEVTRRVASLTGDLGGPRALGTFSAS